MHSNPLSRTLFPGGDDLSPFPGGGEDLSPFPGGDLSPFPGGGFKPFSPDEQ